MAVSEFGRIEIDNKAYTIAPEDKAYVVNEVPSHSDLDSKMERRVIYKQFSNGILSKRDEASVDATLVQSPSFSYFRQNRMSSGIYWAQGTDTRIGDRIFPQRAIGVNNTFPTNGQAPFRIMDGPVFSFAITPNNIFALDLANNWTLSATTVPTITDAISWGGNVYLAVGSTNGFYTWSQASLTTTWTQRTPTASYFTKVRDQLWRASGSNIYSTVNTDPNSQVWSGATVIGDPNTNITGLDTFQDFLMVFKQDGIYSADKSGAVYPIFPGFKNLGTNPRPLGQWRDDYYFASDFGLIWAYNKNGDVNRIGFDRSEPYPMSQTPTQTNYSIPNAVAFGVPLLNHFIVCFQQVDADSTGGAYWLAWDGTAWNPFQYQPGAIALCVGQTGGQLNPVNPVLQFAYQSRASGTNYIAFMSNPNLDPYIAANFDISPQVLYLPTDNGALEDENKVVEKITACVDNPIAGNLKIAYALDDDLIKMNYTDMGPPIGSATTAFQVFKPPTPLPTWLRSGLRLTLTANTSNSAPIVRYIIMHYMQKIPQRKSWTIQILADKSILGPSGRLDVRNAKQILKDLDIARINDTQVPFVDANGDKFQVYVDKVTQEVKVIKNISGTLPSYIVTVELVAAASGT